MPYYRYARSAAERKSNTLNGKFIRLELRGSTFANIGGNLKAGTAEFANHLRKRQSRGDTYRQTPVMACASRSLKVSGSRPKLSSMVRSRL